MTKRKFVIITTFCIFFKITFLKVPPGWQKEKRKKPGWQTGRIETPLDTIKVAAHFQQSDVIPDDRYQLQLVKQIPS